MTSATRNRLLAIIFSLGQPQLSDSQGRLVNATTVPPSAFRFYDPNEDGRSTAADALFVINILFLQSLGAFGEGELAPAQPALLEHREINVNEPEDVLLIGNSVLERNAKVVVQELTLAPPIANDKREPVCR